MKKINIIFIGFGLLAIFWVWYLVNSHVSLKHDQIIKYKIEKIDLVKQSTYQNHVEKSIGIPTPVLNRFHYNVRLVNEVDTVEVEVIKRMEVIDVSKWIGDSVVFHKGKIYNDIVRKP